VNQRSVTPMTIMVETSCPYCGEPVEVDVDEDGGTHQAYVEDCPVCCRPWHVETYQDRSGEWVAILRTSDE
jgi:hypothetical protein